MGKAPGALAAACKSLSRSLMPRLVWPIEYDGEMIQNVPSKNAPRLVTA